MSHIHQYLLFINHNICYDNDINDEKKGFSDPYVYVWCLPDSTKTRCKTKIVFKNLNPYWNESFEFEADPSDPEAIIKIEVWDHDMLSSDDFMGTCTVPLSKLVGKDAVDEWYTLQPRQNKKDTVSGDIRLKVFVNQGGADNSQFSFQAKEREKRFIDIVNEDVLKSLDSSERKRQEIIFEFINTEDQYCKDLNIIINSFLNPLRESSMITNRDISLLFSNLEAIKPVNEDLLADLLSRQKENPIINEISDVFLTHVDKLSVYSMYCSNQTSATEHVELLREKNQSFANFLDEKRPECRNLPLQGFLVKPLQRLCKYPLLLRELLKETPERHNDYINLNAAIIKIKSIVDHANERTRQVDQFKKYQLIKDLLQKSNCDDVLSFGRKFLLQTNPTLLRDKPFEVMVLLFNDLFFVCKQRKDVVFPLKSFPLRESVFRSVDDGENATIIECKLIDDVWKFEMNSIDEKRTLLSKIFEIKDNLLYDEIIAREHSLSFDEQIKTTREFVEGDNEAFDMKVKILELVETIKKERSLRILAERSNSHSKQKISELAITIDVLESQLSSSNQSSFKSPRVVDNNIGSNNNILNNLNIMNNTIDSSSSILKKKKLPSKKKIGRRKKREKEDSDITEGLSFRDRAHLRRSRSFDNLRKNSIEQLQFASKPRVTRKNSNQKVKRSESNNIHPNDSVEDVLRKTKRKLSKTQKRVESLEETVERLTKENITLHQTILKQKELRLNLRDQVVALGRENSKLDSELKALKSESK